MVVAVRKSDQIGTLGGRGNLGNLLRPAESLAEGARHLPRQGPQQSPDLLPGNDEL